MNMSISPNLMSATISPSGTRQPPPPEEGGMAAGSSAIGTMGSTLTNEAKDSLLTGVMELEESGASSGDVKSYVDSKLEAYGVDASSGQQRSGQLVDMMS